MQWAACKWGIDEDVIRASAYQESTWRQSFSGDYEAGRYHSHGILRIRLDDAAGAPVKGGYPDTGARDYAATVQDHYERKPWVAWGYPGKSSKVAFGR